MTRRRSKKRDWKPATTFTTTKLPANGPKPGQTTDQWLYGRQRAQEELMDNPRNKFKDLP